MFSPQAIRRNFEVSGARRDRLEVWFLVIWFAAITAFFSKSQSKLPPYILPVFPALAVLVGRYLADAVKSDRGNRGLRAGLWASAGLLVILLGAVGLAKVPDYHAYLRPQLLPWRFVLGGILAAGASGVAYFLIKGTNRQALLCLVASMSAFLMATNFVLRLTDSRSSKALALNLLPRLQAGDAVYCLGEYVQDFPVYLKRKVDVVGYEGELAFGIHAEPERTASRFIDASTFGARWKTGSTAYALVFRQYKQGFLDDAKLPYKVVAETPRYVLVTNQTP
jgi:4-amino-4-deoxy-L-arabinose transferase-like glycosyltransferase